MHQQHLNLIKTLMNQNEWTTASSLSLKLDLSIRTIKNYITDINFEINNLITSSQKGYRIDKKEAGTFLTQYEKDIPQTFEERIKYILKVLFTTDLEHAKQINIYDLSEELYVSHTTIRNDIHRVKEMLDKYDLFLEVYDDTLSINGSEKNKRKMMINVLFHESGEKIIDIKTIQKYFPEYDISFIKKNIEFVSHKYHCFMNDYSLASLIIHITIAIDRIKNNYSNPSVVNTFITTDSKEYAIANELASIFNEQFHIVFNTNEIYELSLLIISRIMNIDYHLINKHNIGNIIEEDYLTLIHQILHDIDEHFYLNLNDFYFVVRLSIHVKNLVIRSKTNYFIKNPLTSSIKSNCPFIYEIAVFISNRLNEFFHININSDEIAYIAFHIGSALETQKSLQNKVSCILVCPKYYDMNLKIADTLQKRFHDDLVLTNIYFSAEDLQTKTNIDLILTITDLSLVTDAFVQKINPFVTQNDIYTIQYNITKIKEMKKNRIFRERLNDIFNWDIFSADTSYKTRDEVLKALTRKMYEQGYVHKNYLNEILAREEMSSTVFGNIAIPHSMVMDSFRTGIYVLLQEKPIEWDQNKVNIILLFSINKNERSAFRDIFESVTDILSEPKNIKKIISCKTYDNFIDTLSNLFIENCRLDLD